VEVLREQYLELMTFSASHRPMLGMLFGAMTGLEESWRSQGASEEEINFSAFGFDYPRIQRLEVNTGLDSPLVEKVLDETDEAITRLDLYGRRTKLYKKHASIEHPLDYPVTDMDSWLKLKGFYEFSERRLPDGWDHNIDPEAVVVVRIPGGFDEPRQLMGEEALCMAYYDQSELVVDMLDTIGRTAMEVLQQVSEKVRIDQLSVHEDMAGKSGSLIGPDMIQKFVKPYYRRIWDLLQSRGAKLFAQDSDGNMDTVIPAFMDAGVNVMFPFEPAAGMDMVMARKRYGPKMGIIGGIDKFVLLKTPEAIRRELEYKLQPLMQAGGTVFGLDHRIPENATLESFRYYVRTAREILGLDPHVVCDPNWRKVAF